MEDRRLAVPARAPRRNAVAALIVAAIALSSSLAGAVPKNPKARAAFDDGIAAYQKSDWAAAAAAFGKSYGIEPDVEALFAWAQSERQQDHCEKAIELYGKLLESSLPDENKQVVGEKLAECKKLVAAKNPEPVPEVTPEIKPEPKPAPTPEPVNPEGKSRFKDPLGGVLLGTGVVALGVGTYFLVAAKGADSDAKSATNYFDVERFNDDADSKGKVGVIAAVAGGALIAAGIIRYATRGPTSRAVTGWITPDGGGGIAAFGRF